MIWAVASLCIALSLLPAEPLLGAGGHAILPGTYSLEWTVPDSYCVMPPAGYGELKPMLLGEARRFQGLASNRGYWGHSGRFTVVVDESGGPGSGYDLMYVLVDVGSKARVKLAEGVRIPLAPYEGDDVRTLMCPDERARTTLELTFGDGPDAVTRAVGVDGGVMQEADLGDRYHPAQFALFLRGGWYGYARTPKGEARVMTCDANLNGRFGDKFTRESDGDGVVLVRATELSSEMVFAGRCGQVLQSGTDFYSLDVSPAGDSFSVLPYTDLAALEVLPEAAGTQAKITGIEISGDKGHFSFDGKQSQVPVPAMHCELVRLEADFAPGVRPPRDFTASIERTVNAQLEPGSTLSMDLAAPLNMKVTPREKQVKPGEWCYIGIGFSLGDDPMAVYSSRTVTVNVRNKAGKLLLSTKAGFG